MEATGVIQLKGAAELHWRTVGKVTSSIPAQRIIEASIEGIGISLQGHLSLEPTPGTGRWMLDSATLDLQPWFTPLTEALRLRDTIGDLEISGELNAEGSGTVTHGNLGGRLRVSLSEGTMASDARALRLSGITLAGVFGGPSPLRSIGFSSLSFLEGIFSGVTVHRGHVDFAITENHELLIRSAHVEVLGGSIEVREEKFPLEAVLLGDVGATVHLSNLNLAEIRALIPDVIAEARGRVSGEIRVGWKPGEGFRLGDGRFQMERPESVEIRLTPQPGFLTSHTPERLTLLPAWTGALQKWFSPRNPAHETLRQIEMGLMSLQVETLSAEMHPAGDALGRSATVRISARPAVPSAVDRIDFEVNVSGPLDDVIKLGMNQKISIRNGNAP
ncbi:MAG: YdbH domain-containing protein [Opitutaceae bacterium]|nr:YdbH domain-containing protein [Opitutaceae bacterium]